MPLSQECDGTICYAALGSGRRLATVSIATPRCPLSLQYARVALQKEMYSSTLFDSSKYLCAAPGLSASNWSNY
ncbi:DNA-dependent RNA polymerase beta' subunit/160 kD subunit [Giardia duodenalis assemblage B]|uniref:DNA-dependent RNA polymerase beta' subunit/160 kD subunit n=1 Tax=Giardia duodenalis assemblage B TaxID=1394984 RepID=A0A132NRP1_GIAIN|nr:DNA-dependent RNA polymerase beta' subunit/160 kD subunit [Giardia intestinalis assemblage B]